MVALNTLGTDLGTQDILAVNEEPVIADEALTCGDCVVEEATLRETSSPTIKPATVTAHDYNHCTNRY